MGGLGSGRWKDRGRKTVESCWMLDVNRFSEKGCLRPGCSSVCRWIVDHEVASISLRAEAGRLHLSYTVRVGDGKSEDVVETIPVVHLRCRFGGSRAYLICPGPGDGTDCGRRIIKLYLSRRYFRCRRCNELTYSSQVENRWRRAVRRADKLRERLGIGVGIADRPNKPKFMRTRTYARLLDELLNAERLMYGAQLSMIKQLAQLGDDLK
jgi:hypothetical protein